MDSISNSKPKQDTGSQDIGDETIPVVLSVLDDQDCRCMIRALQIEGGALTAQDLSEKWEIPLSTVYRKLRLLQDAGLVEESTEIRMDGKHTSRYRLNFEEVVIRLTKDEFQTHISQGDKPKFTDRLRQ